jgi:hypothetical protein
MAFRCAAMTAFAIALAVILGVPGPAFAQQKKSAGNHQACLAKARAENPNRADGRQREAAYRRCMGR